VTKRLSRPTAIVLLLAALWSLVLVLAAFFVHIPVRAGSRNLVRTASGAYIEVPIRPQTYFQKYGLSELIVVGLGVAVTFVLALALRRRAEQGAAGAGGKAWALSGTGLSLGVVGFVTIAPYLLVTGVLLVVACRTVSGTAVEASRSEGGPRSLSVSSPREGR
jgi:hypothetical protein